MKLTRSQIQTAVRKPRWQSYRKTLKGKTTKTKLRSLQAYLTTHAHSKESKIQVTNYINALKRAGQL